MNNIKTFTAEHDKFYEEFEQWQKEAIKSNLPESGVYKLYAGEPTSRVLKVDPEGILYIGKGIILPYHNRIGKFVNALNGTEGNVHDAGHRYATHDGLKKLFKLKNMSIKIELVEEPEVLEKGLLEGYYKDFGDLPPFNRMS